MGDFANGLVIAILVVAAVVFLVLWIQALRGIYSSPMGPFSRILWTIVVTLTIPGGILLWFIFGPRSAGDKRALARQRRWSRERQVNTTVDTEALTADAA